MQKLSAELFEQIVGSLTSDRSLRIHEKRVKPRVGLRSSLDVIACDKGKQWSGAAVLWVRDVSADGLGLVSSVPLDEDMSFIAEFNRCGNESLHVMYKVAYCKLLAPGIYSVGARLTDVMPEKALPSKGKGKVAARAR